MDNKLQQIQKEFIKYQEAYENEFMDIEIPCSLADKVGYLLAQINERDKKIKRYEEAFEYASKAIYTQHCTMNHMENTEFERGQIDGLIQASKILDKARKI